MKYELRLQMNFRSAFGELKRQTKDNVSCSEKAMLCRHLKATNVTIGQLHIPRKHMTQFERDVAL